MLRVFSTPLFLGAVVFLVSIQPHYLSVEGEALTGTMAATPYLTMSANTAGVAPVSASVTPQSINIRFAGMLSHVRWLIEQENKAVGGDNDNDGDHVSRDLLAKQVDRIYDSSSDRFSEIADSFNTAELTVSGDTTLEGVLAVSSALSAPYLTVNSNTGTSTFSGALSVGTTTSFERFTLDGAAYLADISAPPPLTTNRLYSNGGDLYWADNLIGGACRHLGDRWC